MHYMAICFLKDILVSEMLRYRECLRVKDTAWRACMCVCVCVCACVCVLVIQLCLSLCNFMDCSLPGSSVHEILQTRRLQHCHDLLQGIFPTQGSNPRLQHCRQILYHLMSKVKPA